MVMKFLSSKLWISILFIPFMVVSCEVGGLGGLSGGSSGSNDEPEDQLSSGAELIEGYECVDLGLSVRWATYNVGAYSERDLGGFYSWGETVEKDEYSRASYLHSVVTADYDWLFTKYCTDSTYGYEYFYDDKVILDPEDDVAHIEWKGDWRMPTPDELQELMDNCTWEWITTKNLSGREMSGFKVTSKKKGFTDHFIFLPAGGYKEDEKTLARNSYGNYWSNTLLEAERVFRVYAQILVLQGGKYMDEEKTYMSGASRERGLSVRAVHP